MRRTVILFLVFCLLLGSAGAAGAPDGEQTYLVKYRLPPDDAPFHTVNGAELERLIARDALVWYAPDEEIPLEEPERKSPYYGEEAWNLEMIGAGRAMELGQTGRGVRVGVIDSGVSAHPDLAENLVPGYNYITNAKDPENAADRYGHGTRVAGLIAAHSEEESIGAAPGATIVPLKCTDEKSVKVSAICRAIYGGVDDFDCDILNISIGISSENPALREAVEYAEANDVLIVAAVGNIGSRTVYYPAGYDGTLGVGSVDRTGTVYLNSNHNEHVFLTAPGVNVRSTHYRGGYTSSTGTSFAVPHVSAAAAVLKGADPTLTAAQISRLLELGAQDAGAEGYDTYYGHGIVNIGASLELLLSGELPPLPPEPPEPPDTPDPPEPPDPPESPDLPEPTIFDEITACPRDAACPMCGFSDLDPALWYHGGIHFAVATGMMLGVGENLFRPDGNTTRAMLVTMLHRLDGGQTAGEAAFSDVTADAYYSGAVAWAQAEGIVNGYPDGAFRPDRTVTRQELAAMLCRYAAYRGMEIDAEAGISRFPDAGEVAPYALSAMVWAVDAGIIQGAYAGGRTLLIPGGDATRAQTAQMLARLCLALTSEE